jgi:hypothetical protein
MAKTPHKPAARTATRTSRTSVPSGDAPAATPDETYRPTAVDIFALSSQLGPATADEVALLTAGHTDAALVEIGNDFATARATADGLRILGVAASFLQRAPAADQEAVDLTLDVVRIGAWAAAEDARANATHESASASRRTGDAGAAAEATQVIERARVAKVKLANTVRAVAQSPAVSVAITHALAPAANGAASAGPEASLALLVKEGRALVASKDAGMKRRAEMFKLTKARLDAVAALAEQAVEAARVISSPKVVVTQEKVDWWDGVTYVILQSVVRAFQGARATHPGVPRVEFVSLRKQANGGGEGKGGGGGAAGGGVEGKGGGGTA